MSPDYVQFVKDWFAKDFHGDSTFGTYFTDHLEGSSHHTLLEFLHYNIILYDQQMLSGSAYRPNKEPHVYSLLSRISLEQENRGNINL